MLSHAEALESILGRLAPGHSHRKFLEVELYQTLAGKRGESRLQSRFKEFYLDGEFHVLWDVNLSIGSWKVQMDGLLLTEKCALIIESKNISGKIHFDEKTGEFYRFDDENVKTVMEDPRIQLNKNKRFLAQWFKSKKINLPIEGLIVFTAKKCEFISKPADAYICKAYQMADCLLKILSTFPFEATNLKLLKLKKLLQNSRTPYRQTPLCQYYYIEPADVKPGVYCRSCKLLTMQRDKRSWTCNKCGERDKEAHHFAIREYFSLIDTQLTNQRLRDFCRFSSRAAASRLLAQFDLETTGELKSRVYFLKKKE